MRTAPVRINRKIAVAAAAALIAGVTITAHASASPTAPSATTTVPVLEKDAQAFADAAAKNPPIYTLSYGDARKALDSAQAGPVDKLPADISHRTLKVGPTGEVTIRIVRPAGVSGKLPAVMYFHGGGWVLGNENTHDRLVRQIANGARAAVIFVDYTPSPEARYPIAIEQAYAATKWVAEHGDEINVDGSRIAVAGDSVGGNMTAAVTLMAKQRRGPALREQVLFYPVTDANFNTASYREFADGPWLTRKAMKWFWDAYAPNAKDRKQILASPLRASLNQLEGLPKALVITDEADVLRDEGEAYAAKLRAAGNDITTVRYQGTIHDFAMLNALAHTNAAKTAVDQANHFLYTGLHSGS
ncbi:alpha/beta hydrolase [Streptomyces sp. NPDC059866]|jgi:acetyl esterase|uniref:alpha/beta hydrolase n=1 Tax=unclassified Streptomyces TaxID=2593676 RepID=UPI00225066B0|nr:MULTISPECIES: alpha/beta hydrolase [unclassified Streptomyces]MCX4461551.1 alpha/beta hydrolase [Streptomyces sp. NBC_01719]MCX4490458.1 alpha/beta hydrolase [Streptomyces sp. NBC_01728]